MGGSSSRHPGQVHGGRDTQCSHRSALRHALGCGVLTVPGGSSYTPCQPSSVPRTIMPEVSTCAPGDGESIRTVISPLHTATSIKCATTARTTPALAQGRLPGWMALAIKLDAVLSATRSVAFHPMVRSASCCWSWWLRACTSARGHAWLSMGACPLGNWMYPPPPPRPRG